MLIGIHVSPAGGPAQAVARGVERAADAIQIFNQSPRAWRARDYTEDEVSAYHDAFGPTPVQALLIHAVYLLNCASEDRELRTKSLTALTIALRAGDALGARGVVLHPGSALKGAVAPAIKRAGAVLAEALAESERCPLHLENTAGSGGTLGRSFEELAALIEAAGADDRIGLCLDSCHLYASGFDIRTTDGLSAALDHCFSLIGRERLGSLHLNDSKVPLGSNVDRHAPVGAGELGDDGCSVFLSEPRFEGLPCVLETPSPDREGPAEIAYMRKLRQKGLRRRARA